VLLLVASVLAGPARAAAQIDGISDQSLPAWDGTFADSPLPSMLAAGLQAPARQISRARYVVQWDALAQPSRGPDPAGDYRERLEAWLADVADIGLEPVLALTSYDGTYPASPGAYASALRELLARAPALGGAIRYVEPWNEPNNQGRETPARAAALADAAYAVCLELGCTVIAGDFEDGHALAAYERSYVRALTFTPRVWGVHPYADLAARSSAPLRAFRAGLPADAQVWFTEVASFYCRQGHVLGQAAQVAQAVFLRHLLSDPSTAPAHAFYYGLQFADGAPAPCAAGGGDDSELFAPGDRPRAAAAVLLAGAGPLTLFGPAPGPQLGG
jgi:hypothetical protein